MRSDLRTFTALTAFELRRRWSGPGSTASLAAVAVAAPLLGWWVADGHLLTPDAGRLWGYVQVAVLSLVYRFDLAHDMDRGVADLLAPNLVPVPGLLAARVASAIAALLAFLLVSGLALAAAPGLDLRFAAWSTGACALVALGCAPAVLLAELCLRTRLPVLAVALLALAGLLSAAGLGLPPESPVFRGLQVLGSGSFAALGALAARLLPWSAALTLALLPVAARHWRPR